MEYHFFEKNMKKIRVNQFFFEISDFLTKIWKKSGGSPKNVKFSTKIWKIEKHLGVSQKMSIFWQNSEKGQKKIAYNRNKKRNKIDDTKVLWEWEWEDEEEEE